MIELLSEPKGRDGTRPTTKGRTRVSLTKRIARIGLLMAAAAAILYWINHHATVSFADGLRYLREAQQIDRGDYAGGLLRAVDHPMHPLAIVAAHRLLIDRSGPYEGQSPLDWQTAAQAASTLALVLTFWPLYLLARDLFDDEATALLGCLLVLANPVIAYISVNVLSETTFLLFWTWGLWASIRFLREGWFTWLPPAIGFGTLAYLTRPEGLLLHLALVATLLLLPLTRATRIYWPRWWAALGLLVIGPAVLVGPYVAMKGGLGTKPAVARVIGTMAESPPSALERERPLPSDQTAWQTYTIAATRAARAFRGAVTWPLIPLAIFGLVVLRPGADRGRIWIFLGVIITASALALVRLHATGGYCTVRHALVPGLLLTLAAANGIVWLLRNTVIDAAKLRLGEGRFRPGPAIWMMVLGALVVWPIYRGTTSFNSSFAPYRMVGSWISGAPETAGRVLDLTDWSLFFGNRPGYGIGKVDEAIHRPDLRWVVLRDAHFNGHGQSSRLARELIAGREPVGRFPETIGPGQIQVIVYDLTTPTAAQAAAEAKESAARR